VHVVVLETMVLVSSGLEAKSAGLGLGLDTYGHRLLLTFLMLIFEATSCQTGRICVIPPCVLEVQQALLLLGRL